MTCADAPRMIVVVARQSRTGTGARTRRSLRALAGMGNSGGTIDPMDPDAALQPSCGKRWR